MADANFSVALGNQISRDALKAQADLKSLEAQLRSLNKAAAEAKGADSLKRWGLTDAIKQARAAKQGVAANEAMRAAKQARAMREQSRAAAAQEAARVKSAATQAKLAAAQAKHVADFRQFKADNSLGNQIGAAMPFSMEGAALGAVTALTAAITAAVAALGTLAYKFSESTYEAAKFAQTSTKALGYLTGSAETGAAEFDNTRAQAELLGLDVDKTVGSFKKLLAAQFEIGKARELIAMGSDLKAVVGLTDDDVAGVMLAITQIKAKGRLMAQEMLQLQERGVSSELVYAALGKRMHKTTDELRKMQEAGKLTSDIALDAIMDAVMKKTGTSRPGEAGEDFANTTIEGMEAVLRAQWRNMWIDMGKAVLPALMPLIQQLASLLKDVLGDPEVQAMGKRFLEQFKLFGDWVHENWPEIKDEFKEGLKDIGATIEMTIEVVKFLKDNWEILKMTGIGLAIIFGLIAAAAFTIMLPLYLLIGLVALVIGAIVMVIDYLIAAVPRWYEAGANVVQGLIDGIKSKFNEVIELARKLAAAVSNPFAAELIMGSPSKLFEQYGMFTVQGYVRGIEANDNAVRGVTANLAGEAVRGAVDTLEAGGAPSSRGEVSIGEINITVPNGDAKAIRHSIEAELIELLDGTYG